jgi:hypothetical protein
MSAEPDPQLVQSIVASMQYDIDEADSSKLKLKLVIHNQSKKSIFIDLKGFPECIVFNPANKDPNDASGINPEKLNLNGQEAAPPILEADHEITKIISIPRPNEFSIKSPPQYFKLVTVSAFVDDHGHPIGPMGWSFFLVGKISKEKF